MLSRLRNLLPFQSTSANTSHQSTEQQMPFITGSQPWLKPYILAALAHPPKPPALNAHYLQAVSSVSPRRELIVFDGHFNIPAVLSQSAASLLDADEDDTGVTTRNLLGHVLAPVSVLVVPDMSTTPPTATLLIKEVRVFADRVHQRPAGRVPLVYTDLQVCDALRATIGRQLASYATATVLERADRATEFHDEENNQNDSNLEKTDQDLSLPPPGLVKDSENFAMRPNRGIASGSGAGEHDDPEALEIIPEDPTPPEPEKQENPTKVTAPGHSPSEQRDSDWDITFTQDPAETQGEENATADYLPQTQHFAVDDDDDDDDDALDDEELNDDKNKDPDFDIRDNEAENNTSDANPSSNEREKSAEENTPRVESPMSPIAKAGAQLTNPASRDEPHSSKKRQEPGPRTPERRRLRSDREKVDSPLKQSEGSPKESPTRPIRRSPRHSSPKSPMQSASYDKKAMESEKHETNEEEEDPSNVRRSPRFSRKKSTVHPSLQTAVMKNTPRRPRSTEQPKRDPDNDGVITQASPANEPQSEPHRPGKRKASTPARPALQVSAKSALQVSHYAHSESKTVSQTGAISPSRKVSEKENLIQEEKNGKDDVVRTAGELNAKKKDEVHKKPSQNGDKNVQSSTGTPQPIGRTDPSPNVSLPSAADPVQNESAKRGTKRKASGSTPVDKLFFNPAGDEGEPRSDNPEPFLDKLRAEMEEMRRFRDRIDKNPDGYKTDPDGFLPSAKSARHSARRRLTFPDYPPPSQGINRALDVPESAPI